MMRPLEGITVLDFTQAYSGPYCAMNLADYGARVIKVERVDGGDQSRFWNPYAANGNSGYFAIYNRNKEGITVDLGEPEGKEIIKKLYAEVDVVLENFKYGTLEKLSLGYDVAKEINPSIIFSSITGFGQTGPLRKNTAYDNVIECMCGFMDMTGFPEDPPLRSGASVGDSYTGLTMSLAIALACYDRKRTGKGRRVDVSMLDTMFATIEDAVLAYSLTGEQISRAGNAKPREIVPYDAYDCADGYVAVTITEDSMWPEFCKALDMPQLIEDPLYATNDLRCKNYEKFTELMKKVMSGKTEKWLLERFEQYKVPAMKVYAPIEAMAHPQIIARDMIIDIEDPNVGHFRGFGIPVKFSETPGCINKPSPLLGEDTCAVLKEIGYAQEEIEALIKEEIVGIPEGK
ncbi:MAG: CoA transferase [Clostridiales bacterium]|nr:CoA transferase [Clostridiales bacterium]